MVEEANVVVNEGGGNRRAGEETAATLVKGVATIKLSGLARSSRHQARDGQILWLQSSSYDRSTRYGGPRPLDSHRRYLVLLACRPPHQEEEKRESQERRRRCGQARLAVVMTMCYEEVGGPAAAEEAWEKRRTDSVSDYGGEDEVLGRGTMAATL